jgi:hypothetical protein
MTMRGNAYIADNKARSGGGVRIYDAELIMQDNAVIKGNAAHDEDNLLYGGGGIYSVDGNITLRDNSAVTGNSAAYGGGVYRKMSALTEEGGTVSGNTSTVRDGDVYENNA